MGGTLRRRSTSEVPHKIFTVAVNGDPCRNGFSAALDLKFDHSPAIYYTGDPLSF